MVVTNKALFVLNWGLGVWDGDLITPPSHSLVSVLDVTHEPQPLFCRLQGLGVTASRTPTP